VEISNRAFYVTLKRFDNLFRFKPDSSISRDVRSRTITPSSATRLRAESGHERITSSRYSRKRISEAQTVRESPSTVAWIGRFPATPVLPVASSSFGLGLSTTNRRNGISSTNGTDNEKQGFDDLGSRVLPQKCKTLETSTTRSGQKNAEVPGTRLVPDAPIQGTRELATF